jgi:hypothetical protein
MAAIHIGVAESASARSEEGVSFAACAIKQAVAWLACDFTPRAV